jgi:hypothetical protein
MGLETGCVAMMRGTVAFAGLCLLLTSKVGAQEHALEAARLEPLALVRLQVTPRLDGVVEAEEWDAVQPLPLTAYEPTFGAAPSLRSEIRVAHDDTHVWAAGRFYVSDDGDVRSNSLYRDRISGDLFRLMLDTYDDAENAVVFEVSPAGVRRDVAVAGDGTSQNQSWNAYWDAVTTRTAEGWFVEMRIPFSTLRFQDAAGLVRMRMTVARYSASANELVTHPAVSPRFANAPVRPSIARRITLEGVRATRPLHVSPYVLGGASRTYGLNPERTGWVADERTAREAGVDLKYGITNNLTLDLTANTDFAQVEADDQQVNLTRFSLFFPERRQFFQERGGVFEFNTSGFGDNSQLFHSRRIGLTDAGEPLRIYGGARLIGRVGGWDVGVLDMHTEAGEGDGTENFGVLRLRRQVVNPGSWIGGITTSRLAGGGRYNVAYGIDSQLRLFGNEYVTMQWAQTFDDDRARGSDAGMVRASWQRRAARGLVYSATAKWTGPDHMPELGFQQRVDYTLLNGNVRYGWYPGERTAFNNIQPSLNATVIRRNEDGRSETGNATLFLNFALKSGWIGFVTGSTSMEALPVDLVFSPGTTVPAGRHTWRRVSANLFPPSGARFRISLSTSAGEFYDGRQFTASIAPTWSASEHFEIGLDYAHNRLWFDQRDQRLNADILRLRVQAALDARLSATTFVQYNRAADVAVANLRLRYHVSEGRDLYIVYNDRLNTELDAISPELPRSQDRALLVKYVHTLAR